MLPSPLWMWQRNSNQPAPGKPEAVQFDCSAPSLPGIVARAAVLAGEQLFAHDLDGCGCTELSDDGRTLCGHHRRRLVVSRGARHRNGEAGRRARRASVGTGFGLQAITPDFISGLILLAERPVRIGDWVRIGNQEG